MQVNSEQNGKVIFHLRLSAIYELSPQETNQAVAYTFSRG